MTAEYLITGGAGFIGSNIATTLVTSGKQVRILDNFSTGRRQNLESIASDIEVVEGDLRNDADVKKAVNGVRYVIHLGALPSVARSVEDPWSTNEVNVGGTLRLLLAARDAGVDRFVLSSSSSVYGNSPSLPKHEGMTPMPLSPYALSKLAGEHYCRMFHELYGLKTYALRYFNVFGPRQDPASHYAAVIPLFIDALRNDKPPTIHGDGGQTRDFTFIQDVVSANLKCCEAPESAAGAAYNVARGNRTSINELAKAIAESLGKDIEPEHVETRAGDVRDSQADSTLAIQNLGWKSEVTFEEGLRETIDWFCKEPATS